MNVLSGGLTVLSLFDGMSCGRIALERAGIQVTNYFASEIDKHAIKVSKANWNDVTHIGDVTKVSYKDGVLYTEVGEFNVKIDLVIGGSPCQGFSMAGKQLAFDDPRSMLYFKFEDILKQCNPKYFLLENVKMKKEFKDVISERLGVEPVAINSNLVSAQNRYRLYWTNIPNVTQPEDQGIFLKDVVTTESSRFTYKTHPTIDSGARTKNYLQWDIKGGNRKCQSQRAYYLKGKSGTLDTVGQCKILLDDGRVRLLTQIECERLQTVPSMYTAIVGEGQAKRMLGNGWTVDVIAHIFKGIVE